MGYRKFGKERINGREKRPSKRKRRKSVPQYNNKDLVKWGGVKRNDLPRLLIGLVEE